MTTLGCSQPPTVAMVTEKPKSIWDLWVKPVRKDNTRFSGSKQTHSFPDNRGRGKRGRDAFKVGHTPTSCISNPDKDGHRIRNIREIIQRKSVEDRHQQDSGGPPCPFPHRREGPLGSVSLHCDPTSDGVLSHCPLPLLPSERQGTDSGSRHSTLETSLVTLRGNGRRLTRTGAGPGPRDRSSGKAACILSQYPSGT